MEVTGTKKKMLVVMSVLVAMACILLVGCGGGSSDSGSSDQDLSGSKYVGTWKATDMQLEDESEALDEDLVLTPNEDGSATFVSAEETSECTWELTSDGFKTKGDIEMKFTDDGDNIKTKLLGADMIFERQE